MDGKVSDLLSVPTVCAQIDALHYPALQSHYQVVFHQLRTIGMVLVGGYFDKYQQTVALAYLEIVADRIKIGAVHIDTIARLCTSLQASCQDTDSVS